MLLNNLHNIEELPPLEVHSKWRLPLNYILDVVAAEYRVQVPLIKSPSRRGDICAARNAFYLFGRLYGHTWQSIANAVWRENHATPIPGSRAALTNVWMSDREQRRYIRINIRIANACRLLGRDKHS